MHRASLIRQIREIRCPEKASRQLYSYNSYNSLSLNTLIKIFAII